MKKIKIIFTLLACIASVYLYGQAAETKPLRVQQVINKLQLQNEIFYPVSVFSNPQSKMEEGIGPYTQLAVDKQKLNNVFKANYKSIRLDIPLPGNKSIEVLLTQHKIHSPDFELTITDASGKHRTSMNEGRYYYGVIENGKRTMAAISIFENEISGVISDESGNWNLGAKKDNADRYTFFNDREFNLPITFACGTVDNDESANKNGGSGNSTMTLGAGSGNCAKIFFDVASSVVNSMGNSGATNHVNSIFNVESTIYFNDNINVAISSINLWTTIDPFSITNTTDALNSFTNYYVANGYTGNIACLIDNNIGGGGGLAWLTSICNTNQSSYSVCNINQTINGYPTYSWDAEVVTHENGHNLGSRHTHWCGWIGGPIDNCNSCWSPVIPNENGPCTNGPSPGAAGGTIMSYCHGCSGIGINFVNGFGPQPAAAIKAAIANASCINVCTSCNTNLLLTGTTSNGQEDTWWASNEIILANGTIQSGGNTNLNAGVDIILQPNFEVQAGGIFHAAVGCTPSAMPASAVGSNARGVAIKTTTSGNDLFVSPNPFAEQLKAAFELTGNAQVTVNIIDQAGREVQLALSNQQMDKGRQEILLNTAELSPGMYFLVVSINDIKYSKKIVKL